MNEKIVENSNQIITKFGEKIKGHDEQFNTIGDNLTNIKDDYLMVNVKNFGAKGDGVTDDTQSIILAKDKALQQNKTLYFPKGVYCFTDIGNLGKTDFKLEGSGHKEVTLKCISTVQNHKAIRFDAYEGEAPTPILMGMKFKNIIVEGNSLTKYIIFAQGCSRMDWENIYFKNCSTTDGIGLQINGCHECNFKNVTHGHNYTGSTSLKPYTGVVIDNGVRQGVIEGKSTNNTFINCYIENCNYGLHIKNADQPVFITCAVQANDNVGTQIESDSRMCTFIGCANEKNYGVINGKTIDIRDDGRLSTYINCYTDHYIQLGGQQNKIVSGLYRAIYNIGFSNEITNVRVNYRGIDEGGYIDQGTKTKASNIFDLNSSVNDYIYPLKTRKSISVTSSPFTWENTTGKMVEVILQSGDITQAQKERNGSLYLVSPLTPNTHLLAPTEKLVINYTTTPSMSYVEYNGY